MYSHSARAPWFKSIIVSIMIFAMVFTATPKPSEGVILLIVAAAVATPLTIGAVISVIVTDLVLICILGGLGCGGTSPGPDGSCDSTEGDPCTVPNPTCSTDPNVAGTIACDGVTCIIDPATIPPISCTSSSNMCGQTNSGTNSCGVCSVTAPLDSACVGIPLDDPDSLLITPELVREGDEITINWDLKTNYPPNCTITGPMQPANVISNTSNGTFSAGNTVFTFSGDPGVVPYADSTGTMVIRVTGPHRYTLSCGGTPVESDVRVIPTLYES